jgi:hypothetical protein
MKRLCAGCIADAETTYSVLTCSPAGDIKISCIISLAFQYLTIYTTVNCGSVLRHSKCQFIVRRWDIACYTGVCDDAFWSTPPSSLLQVCRTRKSPTIDRYGDNFCFWNSQTHHHPVTTTSDDFQQGCRIGAYTQHEISRLSVPNE